MVFKHRQGLPVLLRWLGHSMDGMLSQIEIVSMAAIPWWSFL